MRVLRTALPAVEVRPLNESYHVATLDNDAQEIFEGTQAFIALHSARVQGPSDNAAEKRV
jgi:hypothetical protein